MTNRNDSPVNLPCPGRRTHRLLTVAKGILIIFLATMAIAPALPVHLVGASGLSSDQPDGGSSQRPAGSIPPNTVGADPVPDLSLPNTVLSRIRDLTQAGGVVQTSPDNLTLYNLGVAIRLLGGPLPHDLLLSSAGRSLSSWSFWKIESHVGNGWAPLISRTSNFTLAGTNSTGTYVIRTMPVSSGTYSGVLKITYKALSSGSLKWDLEFDAATPGQYRLTYVWKDIANTHNLSNSKKQFTTVYDTKSYTMSWDDVPPTFNTTITVSPSEFTLSIDLGSLLAGLAVKVDPNITSTSTDATAYTFQRKVFYEPNGGRYWVFYFDGSGIKYTNSTDGMNWSNPRTMPSGWPAYSDAKVFSPSIFNLGTTVIVATGNSAHVAFLNTYGYLLANITYAVGTISGQTISWVVNTTARQVFSCRNQGFTCQPVDMGYRFVSVTVGSDRLATFSGNWYLRVGGVKACGGSVYSESSVVVVHRGELLTVDGRSGCGSFDTNLDKSVVLPSDSNGGIRVVYELPSGLNGQLRTRLVYGAPTSQVVNPTADAYTLSSHQDQNYGNQTVLTLESAATEAANAFTLFNLPAVPADGQFFSAALNLKFSGAFGTTNATLLIFPANRTWNENTITWRSQPGLYDSGLVSSASVRNGFIANCSLSGGICKDMPVTYDVSQTVSGMYKPPGDINSWSSNGLMLLIYDPGTGSVANYYSRESASPPSLNITFSCCIGPVDIIDPNTLYYFDSVDFSAANDAIYGMHVVYQSGTDGNVTYAYRPASATRWYYNQSVILPPGSNVSPTLTVDYSTNDVYLFAISGSSILMKSKPPSQQWRDRSNVYPVTNRRALHGLGSNLASFSGAASNLRQLLLLWTEGGSPFTVIFASIPILSVWSPYASPVDPWDGNGLSPYGQYFANLGEYVSPSNGMLTVRQTDLTIPGRGLNLEINRIYVEPSSLLNGNAYNNETYQWAPLGNGWQLDFPWMTSGQYPLFIHIQEGQGFRIPIEFWNSGTSSTFENHQGGQFRMARNSTGVYLSDRSAVSYVFDTAHKLTKILDPTGNNITFSYDQTSRMSKITDTVGRTLQFNYNTAGLLSAITQVSGSTTIRTISYAYTGQSLASVTDPASRKTSYQYDSTGWLVTRITYPTGWSTSYAYSQTVQGTQASTYRVFRQMVNSTIVAPATLGTPIRRFEYNYTQGPGDQVTNSTVRAYNGTLTQPVSYTTYTFSFAGVGWNISDTSHIFVRGVQQRFGAQEAPREITLVTDGSGQIRSYTNFYRYDLWGNPIYSRRIINPSTGLYHESFNSYYNNGLPPGFYALEETFSGGNFTRPDVPWTVYNGTWLVKNGAYNGTSPTFNPPNQAFFAWTNFTSPNTSIIASIFVARTVASSDQRVGLIAHYPGVGLREWALVLHNSTSGPKLSLLDENVGWTENSCNTIAYNTWYKFNFTISGKQAWGSVSAPGVSCIPVSTTFTSNDITTATGIGLYAGGYTALFDNVTVTTVAPGITGTVFSNSFIQGGAPSSNLHGALAGTAELQNGPGTVPEETYYSYWPWGGLNQARHRYDPQQNATQWLTTSRVYDRYGDLVKITDSRGNSTLFGYSSAYQSAYLTIENKTLVPGGILISNQYSYNFTMGTVLSRTDPNGFATNYQYDLLGRPTLVTYPGACVSCGSSGSAAYSYDDKANYANVTNSNGWRTRQFYDGLGRLSTIERFLNGVSYSKEMYTYNWQDRVISTTDPVGKTVSSQYDSLGRVTITTKPDANTTSMAYNDLAPWIRITDENGTIRCNVFDRLGRLIQVIEKADGQCNAVAVAGYFYVTSYAYDELGNLVRATTNDYNLFTNPGFETGNFTGWTQTGTVIVGPGHTGAFEAVGHYPDPGTFPNCGSFNFQQNFTSPIPGSYIAAFSYWHAQNGGATLRVFYTDETYSQSTTPTNQNGYTLLNIAYDSTKTVKGIQISKPAGYCATELYDDFLLSLARTTAYSYDNLNRLTKTVYPDATIQAYNHDSNGNLISKVERNGVKTAYGYDSLNRMSTVSYGPTTPSDSYTYDKNGNLLSLNSQNATLSYVYDSRNRVTCSSYSVNGGLVSGPCSGGGGDGSVAAGTLITLENRTSVPVQNLQVGIQLLAYNTTTSQYAVSTVTRLETVQTGDMLVIKTEDPMPLRTDNATIQKLWVKKASGTIGWLSVTQLRTGDYLFNALDQKWTMVMSIKDEPGSFTMYDVYTTAPFDYVANGYLDPPKIPRLGPGLGAMSTPSGNVQAGYSFAYNYQGDALSSIQYNDNLWVSYGYDGLGRITMVSQVGSSGYYAKFSYYPNDELKGVNFGNGLIGNYTYDKLGGVSRIELLNGSGVVLLLNYTYTKTGAVSTVYGNSTNPQGLYTVNEKYAYDSLNRLTDSTVRNGSNTSTLWYSYDSLGNRVAQRQNQIVTQYTIDPGTNELKGSASGSSSVAYAYGLNGNLVSRNSTGPSSQWKYTWDASGNLVKASNYTIVQGYYAYDGLGRKLESKEGTSTTFYAYQGTESLFEISGSTTTDYVYAAGLRVCKVSGATVSYYHTDAVGSTRLVTSATKSILFSNGYLPFGQDNGTPTGAEAYKFTGKPYSTATGMYYDYQRWYDPSTGRFITQDPVKGHRSDPQTLNPYVYVENTPTTLTDPSGMGDYGPCTLTGGWGSCLEDYAGAGLQWFQSLNPVEQQTVEIGAFAAVTFATGGTDLLLVGAAGFGAGFETYLGYSFATGGKPTLSGALEWGTIGFGVATVAYGGYELASGYLSSSSVSALAPLRGSLAVDESAEGLGEDFVAREVTVESKYGPGRIDLLSRDGVYIEVKNTRYLSATRFNRLQLQKYIDAVGAENLQYDLYVGSIDNVSGPFRLLLDQNGVYYRILPYMPL